jgi:hypothetical protein
VIVSSTSAVKALKRPALNPCSSNGAPVDAIEALTGITLAGSQLQDLRAAAANNAIDHVNDSLTRTAAYFGTDARDSEGKGRSVNSVPVSYDDEDRADRWRQLDDPSKAPSAMARMMHKPLAKLHYWPNVNCSVASPPLQATCMDWSLPPIDTGCTAPPYDIADEQREMRKPERPVAGQDIVGRAHTNDQAWVEGAYRTAKNVLNDVFDIKSRIDTRKYRFVCPA